MHIIDISWPISPEMTEYKTKKEVLFTQTKELSRDGAEEHLIQLGSHTGTHIDAPAHFIPGGAYTDSILLDALIGPCLVVDATQVEYKITASFLQNLNLPKTKRLLLKTRNSALDARAPFWQEFISLDPSAAQWIIDNEIELVGIDYLGIERSDPDHRVHMLLLAQNIIILEGLRLAEADPGSYQLLCLPLSVRDLEAAPARAILTKNNLFE